MYLWLTEFVYMGLIGINGTFQLTYNSLLKIQKVWRALTTKRLTNMRKGLKDAKYSMRIFFCVCPHRLQSPPTPHSCESTCVKIQQEFKQPSF